jgi:hypothetical protein
LPFKRWIGLAFYWGILTGNCAFLTWVGYKGDFLQGGGMGGIATMQGADNSPGRCFARPPSLPQAVKRGGKENELFFCVLPSLRFTVERVDQRSVVGVSQQGGKATVQGAD